MKNFKRTKIACYSANICMSAVSCLSPLLFSTFHSAYGISYSLLGTLVLINFCTQLLVDLIFSFYSYKFNLTTVVRIMPALTVIGFFVYGVCPFFAVGYEYLALVVGTVIFSAASGLAEVLISPIIASIPAENPEREMSKLHSVFAWGVVAVILISSLYLFLFGDKYWQYLVLILTTIPVISFFLFLRAEIPLQKSEKETNAKPSVFKNKAILVCILCIFLGGASECTMSQWCSMYLEKALGIPKIYGDIFGVAMFSVFLGLGRTLYAKFGKNVYKTLLCSAIGAFVCYVTASLVDLPIIGLLACALTGFCTAMLWPGTLIMAADVCPTGGVTMYALMAAGGDLGASLAPQLVGVITDGALASPTAGRLATRLGLGVEQLAMKTGLIFASIFPLVAVLCFSFMLRRHKRIEKRKTICIGEERI